jgi:hypothetical protein
MGWSCGTYAADREQLIREACFKQTGVQNSFRVGNDSYFYETSRTEHRDGAITGSVHKDVGNGLYRKSGTFRIEGHGVMTRGPAFMKNVSPLAMYCKDQRSRGIIIGSAESLHPVELPADLTPEWFHNYAVDFYNSYLPGGSRHENLKYLNEMPCIHTIRILNLDTGKEVAKWNAPMFMVYDRPTTTSSSTSNGCVNAVT